MEIQNKTLEEVSKLEFKKEFFSILSEKERRLFAAHQSLPPIISSTPGTSHLRHRYGAAAEILVLCDGGGSNHCRHHLVKEDFQRVVDSIGIPIRFAHYPAYCSKYNPIEHRLFPHVSRACAGAVFRTVSVAEECIAKTTTSKGLSVPVRTTETEYKTKRQVADDFHDTKNIVYDDHLGQWNYVIYPRKV